MIYLTVFLQMINYFYFTEFSVFKLIFPKLNRCAHLLKTIDSKF